MNNDRYTVVIRTPDKRTVVYKGRPSEIVRWVQRRFPRKARDPIKWDAGADMLILEKYKDVGPSELARIMGKPYSKNAIIGRYHRICDRLQGVPEGQTRSKRSAGKTGA